MIVLKNCNQNFKCILNKDKILILLLILFVCKGVLYAFAIIPPTINTTPDDIGHLSYIQYIASEKKLPVLNKVGLEKHAVDIQRTIQIGQGTLSVESYLQDSEYNYDVGNERNWIVQHPPLYYMFAAIIYSMCNIFTDSTSIIILAIRCFSILLGAITLIYMYKSLTVLNSSKIVKYIAAVLFVFSPATQFYLASMSNDPPLICLSAVALYYLLDYIKCNRMKSFYIMVGLCAAIIWTKYTGGLIVLAYCVVYLHHVLTTKTMKQAMLQTIKGALLGSLLLLPLFCFNLYHYGSLFVVANEQTKVYDFNFLYYIKNLGYLYQLFLDLIALIGWEVYLRPTTLHIFLTTCFMLVMAFISYQNYNVNKRVKNISLLSGLVIFGLAYSLSSGVYCAICLASFFVIIVESLMGDTTPNEECSKFNMTINKYMVIMIGIVVGIFAYQQYVIGLHRGMVGATHGRYYYIILVPFIYLLTNALNKLDNKKQKYVLVFTVILTITCEMNMLLQCMERWNW